LKGACPNEYYWSQRRNLPTTEKNENYDFHIMEHPQYSGYKNLKNEIDKCLREDPGFKDCVDITVEKGINHDLEHKVYMYNPKAFQWNIFEEKSGIKLSEVKNDICIIYTFGGGPWGLHKVTPGLIKRYFNQGAEIIIQSNSETVSFWGNYSDAIKATNFIANHFLEQNFKIIIRPQTITAEPKAIKPIQHRREFKQPIFGWVLSGSPQNWRAALKRNIWGLKPIHKIFWVQMKEGDLLFLYATRPVSGVVGIAKVKRVMEENKPYWPDEIAAGKVKYPLRVEFEPVKILPGENWEVKRVLISHLGNIYFHGVNPLTDKELFQTLVNTVKRSMIKHELF
jgi:hypothetical protein